MTAGCVVPRGDVLELVDDIKDAIPGELDDAQDVLDARDNAAGGQGARRLDGRHRDHRRPIPAQPRPAEADRLLADAKSQAEPDGRRGPPAQRADGRRGPRGGLPAGRHPKREYEAATSRAKAEADRLVESGNLSYEKAVQEGIKEQQRLVSQTEVVNAANAEATRLIDTAHAEADRLRGECDIYVDNKLAQFEGLPERHPALGGRGRHQLRTAAGTHDYVQR